MVRQQTVWHIAFISVVKDLWWRIWCRYKVKQWSTVSKNCIEISLKFVPKSSLLWYSIVANHYITNNDSAQWHLCRLAISSFNLKSNLWLLSITSSLPIQISRENSQPEVVANNGAAIKVEDASLPTVSLSGGLPQSQLSSERALALGDKAYQCRYPGCGRLYTTLHHLKVLEQATEGSGQNGLV